MTDFSTMYRKLFNAQADAIDSLQKVIEKLIEVHRQTEELYMCAPETELIVLEA